MVWVFGWVGGVAFPLVVVVVAMDESEQSFHALEWVLEHMGPSFLAPYKLLLLHSKMFTTITPNQGKSHNVNVVVVP